MNNARALFILAAATLAIPLPAQAATCSCAGVPLLSAMDASSTEPGQLNLTYTVDVHEISDLVSGSDDVPDETGRERSALSQVLSGSYGLTDKWAVSALVSHVEHKRRIGISFLGQQESSGYGDSVILIRYNPMQLTPFTRNDLSLGFGARIATGTDDAGGVIALSEDMQPSTGASGRILWSSFSHAFNQAGTLNLAASASYTQNGENRRLYSFGDELNVSTGLNYLDTRLGLGIGAALRYRQTRPDERDGFEIPNTGGKWLDLVPALQYAVNDQLGLTLSGRIPVARDLDGVLQFTTSYSYALAISYSF